MYTTHQLIKFSANDIGEMEQTSSCTGVDAVFSKLSLLTMSICMALSKKLYKSCDVLIFESRLLSSFALFNIFSRILSATIETMHPKNLGITPSYLITNSRGGIILTFAMKRDCVGQILVTVLQL